MKWFLINCLNYTRKRMGENVTKILSKTDIYIRYFSSSINCIAHNIGYVLEILQLFRWILKRLNYLKFTYIRCPPISLYYPRTYVWKPCQNLWNNHFTVGNHYVVLISGSVHNLSQYPELLAKIFRRAFAVHPSLECVRTCINLL